MPIIFSPTGEVGVKGQALIKLCAFKFEIWKNTVEKFKAQEKCLLCEKAVANAVFLANVMSGK